MAVHPDGHFYFFYFRLIIIPTMSLEKTAEKEAEPITIPHYTPGKHIIIDAGNCNLNSLSDLNGFHQLMMRKFSELKLNVLGDVLHQFESGGFTATYCLTESHVAVHTWP